MTSLSKEPFATLTVEITVVPVTYSFVTAWVLRTFIFKLTDITYKREHSKYNKKHRT